MPAIDYVHSKGLSFGLYTCGGNFTCVGGRPGSRDHWEQDAAVFAEWGVDWVKMDWWVLQLSIFPGIAFPAPQHSRPSVFPGMAKSAHSPPSPPRATVFYCPLPPSPPARRCFSTGMDVQTSYGAMSKALNASGRHMAFSMCEWGLENPWEWGNGVAQAWRMHGDHTGNWDSTAEVRDGSAGAGRSPTRSPQQPPTS